MDKSYSGSTAQYLPLLLHCRLHGSVLAGHPQCDPFKIYICGVNTVSPALSNAIAVSLKLCLNCAPK